MAIVQRHRTPDGLLELVVDLTDGEWSVGFAGLPSHTHGDILAELEGGSPESATRTYVADVLASNRVIVIRRMNGVVEDAWVADGPTDDLGRYALPDTTFERRYWNGFALPT